MNKAILGFKCLLLVMCWICNGCSDVESNKSLTNVENFEVFWKVLIQAQHGDANAQYEVGLRYKRGDGINPDERKSMEWFRKAAEQGHVSAMEKLAVCYEKGEGVPQSAEEAAEWRAKAKAK